MITAYASSAEHPERVTFVIRSYGTFTSALHDVRPGAHVYLDGPWGHFSPDRVRDAAGWVLIAGGVGVTPMLSILLTRRDRGDQRPAWLFYSAPDEKALIAKGILDELALDPGVTVVPVLSRAPESWTGERGRLSAEVMRRHLPPDVAGLQCYICGPGPMMDTADAAAREVGLGDDAVHTERFAMA